MRRISSRDNPLWKSLVRLCHSGRERRKQGKCVLEGAHTIHAYVERFGDPDVVVFDADRLAVQLELIALGEAVDPARIAAADHRLFDELAQTATPTGVLAIAPTPVPSSRQPGRFTLLLEDVQDPGNVGTILRIAAAAGASHVFLTAGCAFAWSPKVLRAAQGAHFHLDIVENADVAGVCATFTGTIVATMPAGGVSLYEADLSGRVLLLFGNEGTGLSEAARAAATVAISIPMPGGFESLNAGAAAAICVFEKIRQDLRQRQ